MALSSKIISLEDDDDYVNLLVYGKSGAGKTVFGGSARVLFIAPEDDGTLSAKRQGSKGDKWPVKGWDDVQEAYGYLYDNIEEVREKYDWIVIDSLTEFQQMLLRKILENVVSENPNRDLDIPAIQDHQKWQNMFKRMVKAFNALEINVLYTALVRAETDEEGEDFLTPDLQGKGYQMSQTISSYMTSYGCLQVQRKQNPEYDKETNPKVPRSISVRRITWQDIKTIQGKDRTGVLAPYTEDKSLQEISDMISGAVPAEAAKPARRTRRATTKKAEA